MELHQLEYVVALNKYKQFSLASEKINVSQPSLSYGIKTLEQELRPMRKTPIPLSKK